MHPLLLALQAVTPPPDVPAPSAIHVAAVIASYLWAFARLNDAARWSWAWLPTKLQPVAPALLAFATDAATGLGGAHSFLQIATTVIVDLGPLAAALRGALPASHFKLLDDDSKVALSIARMGKKVPGDFRSSSPPPMSVAAFAIFVFVASVSFGNIALTGCTPQQAADVTKFVEGVVTQALAKSAQLTSVLDQIQSKVAKLSLPEPANADLLNAINFVRVADQAALAEVQDGAKTVEAAEAAYGPVRDAFDKLVGALKAQGVVGADGKALKAVPGEPALNLKPLALEPFRK